MAPSADDVGTDGSEGTAYLFNRDYRSTVRSVSRSVLSGASSGCSRLNYQHYLIRQLAGYLLHPAIPTGSANLRVADVGTGSGIWPIELSSQLPTSARLDGFDISPAQYPPAAWLPPNVHLHTHDAFVPFGQEFEGMYDAVHMRFMVTVLSEETFGQLITNLTSLLKPGGYLQWIDVNPLSSKAIGIDNETPTTLTETLVSLMRTPRPGTSYEWIPRAPDLLTEQGLEVLTSEPILMKDQYRALWNQGHLMGFEEVCARKVEGSQQNGVADEVARLNMEMQAGASLHTDWFCLVCRKQA